MFSRVAIVNRGEAAMRLIHAVREINAREGHTIATIALHTDGERSAMFVREADHAYSLGPASARPYLDHRVLERALLATHADAAWVGWGFVAEDAEFAELCERLGVIFIGPATGRDAPARGQDRRQAARRGGRGAASRPGATARSTSWRRPPRRRRRIGYPLMLKAAAGGGGRGIRVVTSRRELAAAFDRARDEARAVVRQ